MGRMISVEVHVPRESASGDGAEQNVMLGPGERASFGRGAPGRPVGIHLAGREVSRRAGEIAASDDHWRMSNFNRASTYVVENLEGGGEFVKVAPGRLEAPIPFELSRVVLPLTAGFARFTVFAPRHHYLEGDDVETGEPTTAAFGLNPTAKYFLVLLVLCEPRLRDPAALAIPGIPDVLRRLRPLAECRDLTAAAVNFHIDYLAASKLRLRERTGAQDAARIDWKREALVSLALRFDLVREEHLSLLPSRVGSGAR